MKLGVFGGTFDPIHVGHLLVADEVIARLGLEEVLFVPAGQPWLKEDQDVTDARHRLCMVELAVASDPRFRVSDMEVKRPGPSYSADTLQELNRALGEGSQLYLIAGMDALDEVARWHQPRRLLELATVVAVPRPGSQRLDRDALDSVQPGASNDVVIMDGPLIGVSSTEIRQRVGQGQSIKYRVPEPVESYIVEHCLYRG